MHRSISIILSSILLIYLLSAIFDLLSEYVGNQLPWCNRYRESTVGNLTYCMSVFIQTPACVKCRRIYLLLHGNVAAAAELISEGCRLTIRQYKGSICFNHTGIRTEGIAQGIDCTLWLLQFSRCSRAIIRNFFLIHLESDMLRYLHAGTEYKVIQIYVSGIAVIKFDGFYLAIIKISCSF